MAFSTLEKIAVVLLIAIFFFSVKFVLGILYCYAIGPMCNRLDFRKKGKWALVTGCTDGIGKAYARELAERGCHIVLVSRSMDKLKATAEELEKEFQVETKIIQVDFTGDESIYEKVGKEIEGLEIGTLVNNVGVSYAYPEYFLDIPDWDQTVSNHIKANIVSVTKMTKLILPSMVERKKGVIINIGSASSVIPSPLLTVYAATKAYIDKLSEGLDLEYSKHGIIIQTVQPGFVCSNLSGIRRSSLLAPTAEQFVGSSIHLVGTATKTTGYLPHSAFVGVLSGLRLWSKDFANWLVTRTMETNRRKSLKKYKKQ